MRMEWKMKNAMAAIRKIVKCEMVVDAIRHKVLSKKYLGTSLYRLIHRVYEYVTDWRKPNASALMTFNHAFSQIFSTYFLTHHIYTAEAKWRHFPIPASQLSLSILYIVVNALHTMSTHSTMGMLTGIPSTLYPAHTILINPLHASQCMDVTMAMVLVIFLSHSQSLPLPLSHSVGFFLSKVHFYRFEHLKTYAFLMWLTLSKREFQHVICCESCAKVP